MISLPYPILEDPKVDANFRALASAWGDHSQDKVGTVASAATITLPTASLVDVTGVTNITSVTASYPGRIVVLRFAGVLTFTDGSNLKLAGNFATTADDTITLICDGTNWSEVARSAN